MDKNKNIKILSFPNILAFIIILIIFALIIFGLLKLIETTRKNQKLFSSAF